jgi:FkbM family methyltransferase
MPAFLIKVPVTKIKLFIARILYSILSPIFGHSPRIITRDSLKFEVDLSEGIDLSLFLFGNFQKHVAKNRFISLPDNAVIFDVGANFGTMSLYFSKRVPFGSIFAFEPTHYAMKKLKRNLELNPEASSIITPVHTFLSNQSTEAEELKAFSSWKIDRNPGKNEHPVHGGTVMPSSGTPKTTIDDFISDNNISRLDLIKIDTDGHEYEVLTGALLAIDRFKPCIIFEVGRYIMEERGINFESYADLLTSRNYLLSNAANNRLITLDNFSKIIPMKGTIDILAVPIQLK